MTLFGKRLKSLREKAGQTQGQVGRALGKSRESISKYESGERQPDGYIITALAKHFHVSADYLLGLNNDIYYVNSSEIPVKCSADQFYRCIKDEGLMKYFQLALKLKNNGVDIGEAEILINGLIKKNQGNS